MSVPLVPLVSERDVLTEALRQVRMRLPASWRLDLAEVLGGRRRADRLLSLVPPQGSAVTFVVEVKRNLVRRDLPAVLDQLGQQISALPLTRRGVAAPLPFVVSRYLSLPLQDWLAERGVAYADATGNLRVTLDRPAVFLRDVGATKDPWRGPGRPKGNLTGEPAARVVRALVDYAPPYSVPRVVELAGASNGATYRIVDFLNEEALVLRSKRGTIDQVRWRELLRRWSQDYGFLRTNSITSWLAPRGISALTERLTKLGTEPRYAVTGSLAAQTWAPYAPVRAAMIYADDPRGLAEQLDLRPVDSGANVLLAAPAYDVVYDRVSSLNGLQVVAPSQAAADLMTGPGRNPTEGEALLDWMEANVDAWRS